jgi:hypothetical protein
MDGKGQPEGYTIKSKTGRPRVADPDLGPGCSVKSEKTGNVISTI